MVPVRVSLADNKSGHAVTAMPDYRPSLNGAPGGEEICSSSNPDPPRARFDRYYFGRI